jgi:hypothetical protein
LSYLPRVETAPTPGLIGVDGPEYDEFVGFDHPLSEKSRTAAPMTDGE